MYVFDGVNKKINVSTEKDELNVLYLYSEWKRWACNLDNLKFVAAFESDTKPDITGKLIYSIYLINGWELTVFNKQNKDLNIKGGFLFKK